MPALAPPRPQPVGKKEVAQFADVKLRTVHTWRQRKNLPEPDYPSVNGSGAWELATIALWMARTGRLQPERRKEADALCREWHGMPLDDWLAGQPAPTPEELGD